MPELQAKFKVVKMFGSELSDNELRSKVVQAVPKRSVQKELPAISKSTHR